MTRLKWMGIHPIISGIYSKNTYLFLPPQSDGYQYIIFDALTVNFILLKTFSGLLNLKMVYVNPSGWDSIRYSVCRILCLSFLQNIVSVLTEKVQLQKANYRKQNQKGSSVMTCSRTDFIHTLRSKEYFLAYFRYLKT